MAQIKSHGFLVTITDGKAITDVPFIASIIEDIADSVQEYKAAGAKRDNIIARLAVEEMGGEIVSLDLEPAEEPETERIYY